MLTKGSITMTAIRLFLYTDCIVPMSSFFKKRHYYYHYYYYYYKCSI